MGIIIVLLIYAYVAFSLQTIADKTQTQNSWLAWIPVANIYLMCLVAKKPAWWLLLMFIPLVNLVIAVILWMEICEARKKPKPLAFLLFVPIANLILPGYVAFSD